MQLVGNYPIAARLIYEAACPGKPVPCFEGPAAYDSVGQYNELHLDLLRQRAAADPLPE